MSKRDRRDSDGRDRDRRDFDRRESQPEDEHQRRNVEGEAQEGDSLTALKAILSKVATQLKPLSLTPDESIRLVEQLYGTVLDMDVALAGEADDTRKSSTLAYIQNTVIRREGDRLVVEFPNVEEQRAAQAPSAETASAPAAVNAPGPTAVNAPAQAVASASTPHETRVKAAVAAEAPVKAVMAAEGMAKAAMEPAATSLAPKPVPGAEPRDVEAEAPTGTKDDAEAQTRTETEDGAEVEARTETEDGAEVEAPAKAERGAAAGKARAGRPRQSGAARNPRGGRQRQAPSQGQAPSQELGIDPADERRPAERREVEGPEA